MWQQNYEKQQEKIKQYKYKIKRCLDELSRQREENEATIENFTQLCQDLKFRGMDEVEDLSSEIKLMQEQIKTLSKEKANLEFKNSRLAFDIEDLREENEDLLEKIKGLNDKILNTQNEWSLSQDHQGNGLQGCE